MERRGKEEKDMNKIQQPLAPPSYPTRLGQWDNVDGRGEITLKHVVQTLMVHHQDNVHCSG